MSWCLAIFNDEYNISTKSLLGDTRKTINYHHTTQGNNLFIYSLFYVIISYINLGYKFDTLRCENIFNKTFPCRVCIPQTPEVWILLHSLQKKGVGGGGGGVRVNRQVPEVCFYVKLWNTNKTPTWLMDHVVRKDGRISFF